MGTDGNQKEATAEHEESKEGNLKEKSSDNEESTDGTKETAADSKKSKDANTEEAGNTVRDEDSATQAEKAERPYDTEDETKQLREAFQQQAKLADEFIKIGEKQEDANGRYADFSAKIGTA